MEPFKNWHDWKKNLEQIMGEDFLNNFEGIFQHNSFPQMNVYQTENEVLILASIPGLDDMNNVDVYIDYQTIELKGTINLRYKGFRITQDELYSGRFERKLNLPFPVKEDRVDATYQNGLLILHLHRLIPEDQRKQKVSIKKVDE